MATMQNMPEGLRLLLAILNDYFSSIKEIDEQKDEYTYMLGQYQQFSDENVHDDLVRRGNIVKYLTFQTSLKGKIESIKLLVESFIHRFPNTAEGQKKKHDCIHEIEKAIEVYNSKINGMQKGIIELNALKMQDDIESFDFDRESGSFVRAQRIEIKDAQLAELIRKN